MKFCILAALLFWLVPCALGQRETLVTADNPKPAELPTLSVWQQKSQDRVLTHVASTFPNVPNFTCDTWCYETDVDFLDAKPLDGGRLQLRHRWKAQPQTICVTTVTPEPGAVEFL
ncbi:MAG: hypothetical protein FJ278_21735, partial [Planctomycetes bacterium]|nr:hypothetical protein [Planctomycetota bacterium]